MAVALSLPQQRTPHRSKQSPIVLIRRRPIFHSPAPQNMSLGSQLPQPVTPTTSTSPSPKQRTQLQLRNQSQTQTQTQTQTKTRATTPPVSSTDMAGPGNFNPGRCEGCRAKHQKCPGEKPTCSACAKKGIQCVYRSAHERQKLKKVRVQTMRLSSPISTDEDGTYLDRDGEMGMNGAIHGLKRKAATTMEEKRKRGRPGKRVVEIDEGEEFEYAFFDPEERRRLIKQDAAAELEEAETEAEAMIAIRNNNIYSEARAINFSDIDLSHHGPVAVAEWMAMMRRVFQAISFHRTGLEWDTNGEKRAELRGLILEVRALQRARKVNSELVLALGRLVGALRLVHDFYEQLGACMTTIDGLEIAMAPKMERRADREESI